MDEEVVELAREVALDDIRVRGEGEFRGLTQDTTIGRFFVRDEGRKIALTERPTRETVHDEHVGLRGRGHVDHGDVARIDTNSKFLVDFARRPLLPGLTEDEKPARQCPTPELRRDTPLHDQEPPIDRLEQYSDRDGVTPHRPPTHRIRAGARIDLLVVIRMTTERTELPVIRQRRRHDFLTQLNVLISF